LIRTDVTPRAQRIVRSALLSRYITICILTVVTDSYCSANVLQEEELDAGDPKADEAVAALLKAKVESMIADLRAQTADRQAEVGPPHKGQEIVMTQ
jgi:hypothetical protein